MCPPHLSMTMMSSINEEPNRNATAQLCHFLKYLNVVNKRLNNVQHFEQPKMKMLLADAGGGMTGHTCRW
jgi:hypothetical protein